MGDKAKETKTLSAACTEFPQKGRWIRLNDIPIPEKSMS